MPESRIEVASEAVAAGREAALGAARENRTVVEALSRALGRLPADQREALFMVVLQGMSYEEVAEATGCAVGTAKSRVFRARRQLQAWLAGEERPAAAPAQIARADATPERHPGVLHISA